MKHILACCLALLLALAILPSGALAVTAESPIILGGTEDDAIYGILPLPDGNVILSMASGGGRNGIAEYGNNIHKVWLVCLAPDGSTVWETNFGDDREGGYTVLQYLILNDDNTFTGIVWYTISQYPQYRQEMTFSCADGSIVSQGERMIESVDDSLYRQFFLNGKMMLLSERVYQSDGHDLHTYRLLDADHQEYWSLDDSAIPIGVLEGWSNSAQGAVLYGKASVLSSKGLHPAAMLVSNDGHVVWTYTPKGIDDMNLLDGIIDSQGRFIASGFVRSVSQTEGEGPKLDHDSYQQLLLCLDLSTGEEIWRRTAGTPDKRLPNRDLMEIDGHYILCDSTDRYSSIIFETVDTEGYELQSWTTPPYNGSIIGPRFFLWDGELWIRSILNGANMDVILERVQLP